MADCLKFKPFISYSRGRVIQIHERLRRHGKKGRRRNKQDRGPRDYPTRWWDQPQTGVSKAVEEEAGR